LPTLAQAYYLLGRITPIDIKENSGNNLSNYAIMIQLSSSWDGWKYVKSDGSDIYFTDANGNPLYFWIDTWDYTNKNAIIWVKVPSIPANSTVRIYMYYGGANPYSSYRNPSKVFVFYDDFEDVPANSYDPRWSNGYVVQDGNNKVLQVSANSNSWASVTLPGKYSGLEIRFWYKIVSKGQYGPRLELKIYDSSSGNGYALRNEIGSYVANYYYMVRIDNTQYTTLVSDGNSYSIGVWYTNNMFVRYPNGSLIGVLGGSSTMTATDTRYNSFDTIVFSTWDSGNVYYIDRVIVRQVVNLEPLVTINPSLAILKDLDLM